MAAALALGSGSGLLALALALALGAGLLGLAFGRVGAYSSLYSRRGRSMSRISLGASRPTRSSPGLAGGREDAGTGALVWGAAGAGVGEAPRLGRALVTPKTARSAMRTAGRGAAVLEGAGWDMGIARPSVVGCDWRGDYAGRWRASPCESSSGGRSCGCGNRGGG